MKELMLAVAASAGGYLIAQVYAPATWSDRGRTLFKRVLGAALFLSVGAYYLATGDEPDKLAYRLLLCPLYQFERCREGAASPERDRLAQEARSAEQSARDAEQRRTAAALERIEKVQQELLKERERAKLPAAADNPAPAQTSPKSTRDDGQSRTAVEPLPEEKEPNRKPDWATRFKEPRKLALNGALLSKNGYRADVDTCAQECLVDTACHGFSIRQDENKCQLFGEVFPGEAIRSYADERAITYMKNSAKQLIVN